MEREIICSDCGEKLSSISQDLAATSEACPNCGSSMFWDMPQNEVAMAVAVGAFADPEFPVPTVSFYEQQRHSWVKVPDRISRYACGRNGKKDKIDWRY